MIRRLALLTLLLAAAWAAMAQQPQAQLFAYPTIPDSITDITERHNYFVSHFWDRADMRKVFSSRPRLAQAFDEFLSPIPYAARDTVRNAVTRLMRSVERDPDNQAYLLSLAEARLYSDSAMYESDDLYVAFLRPFVANRRANKALRQKYMTHITKLNASSLYHPLASIPYTGRDGTQHVFEPTPGKETIIYFNDPGCDDCALARLRLQANVTVQQMLADDTLQVVALSMCEPDEAWQQHVAAWPDSWVVGANPDLDMLLDIRAPVPMFFLLDADGNLMKKNVPAAALLDIL